MPKTRLGRAAPLRRPSPPWRKASWAVLAGRAAQTVGGSPSSGRGNGRAQPQRPDVFATLLPQLKSPQPDPASARTLCDARQRLLDLEFGPPPWASIAREGARLSLSLTRAPRKPPPAGKHGSAVLRLQCASPRANHLIRNVPPSLSAAGISSCSL